MGRVGACSLSGCRTAAMRRLLGLLVCLPVACYSQDQDYYDQDYNSQGCPSHAPDYDRATEMCYYHYGKGCDIVRTTNPDELLACCSNSDCDLRPPLFLSDNFSPDYPVCSERGYCRNRSYQPTGPGCRKERGRVKCDIHPDGTIACPQNRVCVPNQTAGGVTRKRTFSGGGTARWWRNHLDGWGQSFPRDSSKLNPNW